MKKYLSPLSILAIGCQLLAISYLNAQTGTWTKVVTNAPHNNQGVLILMTDGTVICHNSNGSTYGTGWDKLTPNAAGSYINGTWTSIASMNKDRLFFSSQVLPSGEVYVAGGEYGAGGTTGEVYNPVANTWTTCGAIPSRWNVYDAPSELLYNGNVLEGPEIGASGGQPCNSILQWNPTTLNYTTELKEPENHDEAAWIKLPDSTVLTVGMPYPSFPATDSSCRFQPATNTWLVDAMTPTNIYDKYGFESGGGVLLPNGKAIFFGATQYNVIYTPSGNSRTRGTWASAANFPTIGSSVVAQPDAPLAMMVNGHILLAVSPVGTSASNEFLTPAYFLEYDYTTNAFTQVTSTIPGIGADDLAGVLCQQASFLDLPDGTVLMGINQDGNTVSKEYWVYTPGSAAIAQGKPTINSIIPDGCPNYKITGKLFNGISEGTGFGDDQQNSTNYPLVRLTNGTNVYYAKTTNWNRVGAVQTDSLEDTAVFTTPATLPAGTYSLVVVVNGFASNPTLFSVLGASIASYTNPSCGSAGSITASSSGGLSPYTYSWSPGGATGITASNLSAGTYTVTIKDNNGCSVTASATITQSASFSATGSITANVTCNGGTTGSASASVSGSGSPFTYSWSPSGGSNATASGLSAGTYSVSVSNSTCSVIATVTITQPSAIGISTTLTGAACNGTATGGASASTSGGTSPYTYSWSPSGGSGSSASNLSAGTYTLTVKDKNGCTATSSAIITQPASSIEASITSTTNVACFGGTGSTAAAPALGGTSPYTYSWNGGGGTNLTATVTAGIYTLYVTDRNGCTATTSSTITQPAASLGINIASVSNPTCNGYSGTITANAATGGTTPYTYSWTGAGGTNLTASITAGIYTITATDNHGCTATASSTLTQPAVLSTSITSIVNVSCYGGTGSVTASAATGGNSPYTYQWSPSGSTNLNASVSAGTYTITVIDNHGCIALVSAIITQPISALAISISTVTNPLCTGSNGSITANLPTGGTSPYTYSWTPAGGTNLTASNLSGGVYSIIATDNHGCSATASATITQASSLSVSASTITNNTSCSGGYNGSVSATGSGGVSPYTYSWSSGSSSSIATGLSAGIYTITLSDKNGCSATASATISQSSSLGISATTTTNVACFGSNNGIVSSTASGGTSPYTYSWSSGSTNSTQSLLSAGTYTITLSDRNGCTATASAIITQPASLLGISIASLVSPYCNGQSGSITANSANGGTSPYTYSWSSGGGTNLNATYTAGTYSITVIDNQGCSASVPATLTQPALLVIAISSVTNVNCYGGTGSISANGAGGGSLPYTYQWSPSGGTNLNATVSAGTYTITVIDNNGCIALASATITQPSSALGITISSVSNPLCNGTTGAVTANAAVGGTSPYTYSWLPAGGGNLTASNLTAGIYSIIATDNHGCTSTASTTITQPSSLTVSANTLTNNTSCTGGYTGGISASPSGGTSPYTYSWTGGTTNSITTGLSTGTYTVTLTDNNGCTATASATITQPASLSVSANTTSNNTVCSGGYNGSVSSTSSGGTLPYTYLWTGGSINSTETGLSAGTYTITLTDNNGCTATASAVITQSTGLSFSASVITNVACNGGVTGGASASVSGGVSPYTYSWSPNSNSTYIATGLSAGTYSIIVTDNNGCNNIAAVIVTQPAAIRDSASSMTNPTCTGVLGSTTIGVKGGRAPYTYSWSPNTNSTATSSGLSAGTYHILITDANSCSASATVTLTQSSGLTLTPIVSTYVSCSGGTNGQAKVSVAGGVSPYTYSWTPGGSTTYIASTLSAGTYSVTVTDKNGCQNGGVVTVTQPAAIRDSIVSISYPNCTISTGSITIGVKGGTTPYIYSWTPNVSTSPSATGLAVRSYTIMVKDAKGCNSSIIFSISQPPILRDSAVIAQTVNVTCGLGNNGSGTVGVKYGTLPYTFSWSPNVNNTASASGLSVGTYTVTVKDANSCSTTALVTITQTAGLTLTSSVTSNVSCHSGANGQAKVSVAGGYSPYTYSWSPNTNTTYLSTGLSAGTYSVNVTDKNGCTNSAAVVVTQPAAIRDSMAIVTNPTCYAGSGNATVGVKGGASPYIYTWTPSVSTTAAATGLTARSYTVQVKDANGCTTTLNFSITQPLAVRDSIVKASTINILCNGSSTGSATVGVKYGTSPYTYSWNPGGRTTATASGISAGIYTVTVKDGCGNAATASVTITQPAVLRDSISSNTCTSGLGNATVGVKGGASPYTYLWSPGGGTKSTMSALSSGTYTVTITDKNGCSNIITNVVACSASLLNGNNTTTAICCPDVQNISLYPNPNTGQFTIAGLEKGMMIEIYDLTGRKISIISASNETIQVNIPDQANGMYLIRISQNGNLVSEKKILKTQ